MADGDDVTSISARLPHRRILTSRSAWAASGALLLATGAVITGLGGESTSAAIADGSSVVASLGGGWIVIRSGRGRTVDRTPWLLLGAAMVLWGIGEVLWTWCEVIVGDEVPYPSIADISYLGAVPFAVAGLLAFTRGSRSTFHLRTLLDACLVAASLLFITWALVLGPAWRADDSSLAVHAVTVAYPITDLILAALALIIVQSDTTRDRWSLRMVAAAMLLMATADSAFTWIITYGTFSSSNPITMLWPTAYLLIAFSTAFRDGPAHHEPTSQRRIGSVLAPYIPLIGSIAVATPRLVEGRPLGPFLTVNGAVLILLVLVRQAMIAWDLRATVAALHDRETELERLVAEDALTGLGNRSSFASRLDTALDGNGAPPAVVFIDLDGFKQVNDSFGHAAGDELLVEVSRRLRACTTSTMELARLGGDEFVVLVPEGQNAAEDVAKRILESFELPFTREGESIPFRASIGVASAPAGGSPDEAVRRADAAMYVAKSTGKGHAVTYPDDVRGGSPQRL
ncbi:MAG: diguanylate cyclase domain-containing protein [Microthrixaceae bacterium]